MKVRLLALGALLLLATRARAGFDEIRELIRSGKFPEAIAASERHLKQAPKDFRVWTLNGIALQSTGRAAEGLTSLRRALAIEPDFLPALQAAAQIEYQTGDPAAATTLGRVVQKRPHPEVFAMLGVLAFERKDCATSVRHFSGASRAIENQPLARWQFASCLFEVGRYDDAGREFASLLSVKDNDAVRFNLGLAKHTAGDYAAAVSALAPLSRRDRPDADAMSLLAAAYEANKQTPEAISVLRRAVEVHPRDERLYMDLAALCLEHHSVPLALEVMDTGLKNLPVSARMHTVKGLVSMRAGDAETAASHYRKAAELAPADGFGPVAQALLLQQMGAADQAVGLLREQRARGTNAQVDIALAQALLGQGARETELREAEQLLAGIPPGRDARVHTLRAKIHTQRNQPKRAAAALEAALAIEPDDRTAVYQLMVLYTRLGRTAQAAKLKERLKEMLDTEKRNELEAGRYRIVAAPAGQR
jgi:tetratricopeptide (TPR) repeat protein